MSVGNDFSELVETLAKINEQSYQRISAYTRVPEILPCVFDQTVEFWLERISFWGKVKIVKNKREKLTKRQLVDLLADSSLLSVTSKWRFNKLTFKSVEISRSYVDQANKKVKDVVVVDIELDDDIKFIMNYWKNK